MTDENGRAQITLDMPNYMGAVRIMAASAVRGRYGSAEKQVAVKEQLMVLPTLPRVMGPGDKIRIPVTVYVTEPGIRDVTVTLHVEGPVKTISQTRKRLQFDAGNSGDRETYFELAADEAVGTAKIRVEASAGRKTAFSEVELPVRASSPRLFTHSEQELTPGRSVRLQVPAAGISGTNHASVSIRRRPHMHFGYRLKWLMQYPYGCLEQTVSSAFPQLFLPSVTTMASSERADMDKNINAAIARLSRFQLPSGGFGFWPGTRSASVWASNYAGHFLIEAKKKGYHVPPEMMLRWLRFQKSMALQTRDPLLVRIYRVYLMALAGEPPRAAMNLLRENNLRDLNDTEKWLLAAAYQLSGLERTARNILKDTGLRIPEYRAFDRTYGSKLRDRAIILSQLVYFERWEEARTAVEAIASDLTSMSWYSTQTTAFALLAIGQYLEAVEGHETPVMKGRIRLPGGRNVPFETADVDFNLVFETGFGEPFEVRESILLPHPLDDIPVGTVDAEEDERVYRRLIMSGST